MKISRCFGIHIIIVITVLFDLSVVFISKAQQVKSNYITSEYVGKIKRNIEERPNDIKAHEDFLNLFFPKDSIVIKDQYNLWMKHFPKSYVIPFAIGRMFYRREDPQATDYLLKTVLANPNMAEAWHLLSIDAMRRGNDTLIAEYAEKAKKADPKNSEYALAYANSIEKTDVTRSDSLILEIANQFDNTDAAAIAINNLAYNASSFELKSAYYEQLHSRFSMTESSAFRQGMNDYFDNLIDNGYPDKAFELALGMVIDLKKNKLEWKHKLKVAKSFLEVKSFLLKNEPLSAAKILNEINLKDGFSASYIALDESLLLLKAQVWDLINDTQAAYDSIAVFYSRAPTIKLSKAMLTYASKLGMDSLQADSVIYKLRESRAIFADPFNLKEFATSRMVSLSDFKGKVLLLSNWFPGCGPCRREMPFFEAVIRKYSKDQVAYVGINGISQQDAYVIPFMKATGYSFISLMAKPGEDRGNLTAYGGYPHNYLIDQKGRIIYSGFIIGNNRGPSLDLMINELLNKDFRN